MIKLFIYFSIFIIWILALIDVTTIISDSNTIATSRTPSQIEIKKPLNTNDVKSNSVDFQERPQSIHDKFRDKNKPNLQNDINKMNERQKDNSSWQN